MSARWRFVFFFVSSSSRHTRWNWDWSSDVCSSDLPRELTALKPSPAQPAPTPGRFQSHSGGQLGSFLPCFLHNQFGQANLAIGPLEEHDRERAEIEKAAANPH